MGRCCPLHHREHAVQGKEELKTMLSCFEYVYIYIYIHTYIHIYIYIYICIYRILEGTVVYCIRFLDVFGKGL